METDTSDYDTSSSSYSDTDSFTSDYSSSSSSSQNSNYKKKSKKQTKQKKKQPKEKFILENFKNFFYNTKNPMIIHPILTFNSYRFNSPESKILYQNLKTSKIFTDKNFIKKLPKEIEEDYPYTKPYFSRLEEIFSKNSYLIFNGISPSTVIQQDLGDCYLLNAVTSIASRPNLIKSIIQTHIKNSTSFFTIWLNINGKPTKVIIDDEFLMIDRGFNPEILFATPPRKLNSVWTMIIEKAYAKVYGGYHKIDIGGGSANAFRDLCFGAPVEDLDFEDYFEEKKALIGKGWPRKAKMEIWKKIKNGFLKGYLMTTESVEGREDPETKKETMLDNGILGDHAYSLLSAMELKAENGKSVKLLKIRNPYGDEEFEGDWSRDSKKWTEEIKKKLDYDPKNEEEGTFWICLKDFFDYFASINICKIQKNPKYTWKDVKFKKKVKKFRAISRIEITKKGVYSISIDQQDSHSFPLKREEDYSKAHRRHRKRNKEEHKYDFEDNFEFNEVALTIGKLDQNTGKVEFIGYNEYNLRNVFIEKKLDIGIYVILIDIKADEQNIKSEKKGVFEQGYENWRDVVISCYGPEFAKIDVYDFLSKKNYKEIFEFFFVKIWRNLFVNDFEKVKKIKKFMWDFGKNNICKNNQKLNTSQGKIEYQMIIYKFFYMEITQIFNKSKNNIEILYQNSSKNIEFFGPYGTKKVKKGTLNDYVFSLKINAGESDVFISRLIDEDKDPDVQRKKPKVIFFKEKFNKLAKEKNGIYESFYEGEKREKKFKKFDEEKYLFLQNFNPVYEESDKIIEEIRKNELKKIENLETKISFLLDLNARRKKAERVEEDKEDDPLWHKKRKITIFYSAFIKHILENLIGFEDFKEKLRKGLKDRDWKENFEILDDELNKRKEEIMQELAVRGDENARKIENLVEKLENEFLVNNTNHQFSGLGYGWNPEIYYCDIVELNK